MTPRHAPPPRTVRLGVSCHARRAAQFGVGAVTVVALALPAPAAAAELDRRGWWWRPQTGVIDVPPPPGTPDGGLVVSRGPDGATAVAAVRYALRAGETPLQLRLDVADDLGGAGATIVACPAGTSWRAADAGNWNNRPRPSCQRGQASGSAAADGTSWLFPVAALARDGVLDVVLAPGEGSATFQLVFEAPTRASLTTRTSAPQPSPSSTVRPTPTPSSEPPVVVDPGDPDPALPPVLPPVGVTSPAVAAPSAVPSAAPSPAATSAAPANVAARDTDDGSADRAVAAVLAILVLAAGYLAVRHPALADGDPDQPRGLGRFARPRTGAPPPL